jgi:1,4-dihydroxy-2-naphthoate octaprenyltransferase
MKHWIEAARLRTLPLSVSGIIVGSIYALAHPTDEILTPTDVLLEYLWFCHINHSRLANTFQFCK